MMTNLQTWTRRILLAFVFVTIGFALGRQTAPQSPPPAGGQGDIAMHSTGNGDKVIVYAVHMTFRCWECNQIEFLTKELLGKEFADQLASGAIDYQSVDYMKDTDFARRYNIASSTIVLARFEDGQEVGFDRLDEVWTKARNQDEFLAYVRGAILAQLGQLRKKAA
ncbi:MAG TPA: hypothetical protein ENN80_08715 [Candidatus Hydrogenedentes bacterium]|nr:hypothetical protein [Candidatus Hydrogenedentota bacterium]